MLETYCFEHYVSIWLTQLLHLGLFINDFANFTFLGVGKSQLFHFKRVWALKHIFNLTLMKFRCQFYFKRNINSVHVGRLPCFIHSEVTITLSKYMSCTTYHIIERLAEWFVYNCSLLFQSFSDRNELWMHFGKNHFICNHKDCYLQDPSSAFSDRQGLEVKHFCIYLFIYASYETFFKTCLEVNKIVLVTHWTVLSLLLNVNQSCWNSADRKTYSIDTLFYELFEHSFSYLILPQWSAPWRFTNDCKKK